MSPRRRETKAPLLDLPDYLYDSPSIPSWVPPPEIRREKPPTLYSQFSQTTREIRLIFRSKRLRLLVLLSTLYIILWIRLPQSPLVYIGLKDEMCVRSEPIAPSQEYDQIQNINWKKLAYAQYATNTEYLCASLLNFEKLRQFETKASLILLYPNTISLTSTTTDVKLLLKARDEYNVTLIPIGILHNNAAYWSGQNWADSYTKLLSFNQTQYDRLIALDADSTILKSMDELFFIPHTRAALAKAYWLENEEKLSSHVMVIEPNDKDFTLVMREIIMAVGRTDFFDMEIVNKVFGRAGKGECVILPWKEYGLLTGEFRRGKLGHKGWYGGKKGFWSTPEVMRDARLVHFSDSPFGKPWEVSAREVKKEGPKCGNVGEGEVSFCEERGVWVELYREFARRRLDICGMGDG